MEAKLTRVGYAEPLETARKPVHQVSDRAQRAAATLRMATASANADILTDIRSIIKNQLQILKNSALTGAFSASQAQVLHRLAQVYSLLDAHTDKEQRKYDFSQQSEESLTDLERQAKRLLGQ